MHIIRPNGIRMTPTLLAKDLGCQTRRWPGFTGHPNFDRDVFLIYPNASLVETNKPVAYQELSFFFSRDKAGQRQLIRQAGIKAPQIYRSKQDVPNDKYGSSDRFVVRPLHHHASQNYRVTHDPLDFHPGTEYISEFFPKTREYRIVFCFGKPIVFLQKVPAEGTSNEAPWGTETSRFVTIKDWNRSNLRRNTDCFDRLGEHGILRNAHIVAVDVLYAGKDYRVLEYNTCPGLTIDANRKDIVDQIRKNR